MKKQIVALLSVLTMAFCVSGAIVSSGYAESSANQLVLAEGEWNIDSFDTPSYGEKFNIPSATVSHDGNVFTAKSYLITPSGENCSGSDISVSEIGRYTIVYSYQDSNKLYKTEKTFIVNAPFISSGSKTKIEYGTYTKYGSTTNNTGYMLQIAEGEEVTFNKLIDIDSLTAADNLVSLFITPKEQGTADFDKLKLTFTDATDSNNTLTVVVNRVFKNQWPGSECLSYTRAAGNGQDLTGIETKSTGETVHVNNEWGACIPVSFAAVSWSGSQYVGIAPSDWNITVQLDTAENIVKVRGQEVVDLDNSKYFKTLWTGFKSGKARLTISATNYNSTSADIVVTGIYGFDFSETTVSDDTAPNITIETEYTSLPEGVVGKAYKIPEASAIDDYFGERQVETKVFYAYGTANAVNEKIQDGAITPRFKGTYTIVYEANDGYNNVATKTYSFNVVDSVDSIEISTPTYGEYELGDMLEIASVTATGGTGNINIESKILCDGTEVELENNSAKLTKLGSWQVKYTATDYIENKAEKIIDIKLNKPTTLIFSNEPTLPIIMIDGGTYMIPEFYAEDYSTGECVKKLCNVKITTDRGTKEIVSGEKYTASATMNGDMTSFKFVCEGTEYGKVIEVPVIKVKTTKKTTSGTKSVLNLTRYLYDIKSTLDADGTVIPSFTATAESSSINVKAEKAGDCGWTFANALLADSFQIEIETVPNYAKFSGIKIVLTDSADKGNAISVCLEYKNKGKTYLSSSGSEVAIDGGFGEAEATVISLSYSNKIFAIGNNEVTATLKENGKPFTGFMSDKVYVSVIMVDAKADAQYNIKSINLQKLNKNITADYTDPLVRVSGEYGGSYNLGDTYKISATFAGDVLCPETEIVLNVYDADGNIAKDVNGVELKGVDASVTYEIKLDSFGQYKIEYVASEINWQEKNRTRTFQYMINVYDDEAPEIALASDIATTAKVGEKYVLPDITFSDNLTKEENIKTAVYVINPQGNIITLKGKAFTFSLSGKYTFRIFAMDEDGNSATKNIVVKVSD